jgi:L-ascorbate metabolism protein UlaG (beta-lactamase superfamily)
MSLNTSLRFRWLGVAGIELEAGGQILAVDPFFTRPPFWRLWFGRVRPERALVTEHMPRCDDVLVTHAHYDHLMDVPEVARSTGAAVWGSANTCELLAVCGVLPSSIHEIEAGDELALDNFQVEVLPARHLPVPGFSVGPLEPGLQPPLHLRDYRMDVCFSFLIRVGELRLLYWRDVSPQGAPPAEVLFVSPMESGTYYRELLAAVQPQLVIPLHWDDFFRPLHKPLRPFYRPPRLALPPLQRIDLNQFKSVVARNAPLARVLVPELLESYNFRDVFTV